MAYRNLIVHKAGIVDDKFRTATGYRRKLKEPVQLTRGRIENAIRFIENLAGSIEREIDKARAPKK